MHCERCRTQPAEVILGDLSVCMPCAETMAWSLGFPLDPSQLEHVTSGGGYVTGETFTEDPWLLLTPPTALYKGLRDFGIINPITAPKKPAGAAADDGFPWIRVTLVLGGIAAVGVVGLMAVNALKTASTARETIAKHPELLAAL